MKSFIVGLILLLACTCSAADMRWDAPTGQIDGYTAYWGTEEGVYPHSMTVTDTEILDIDNTLNLNPGVIYYFIVKAFNDVGEGDASNSVDYEMSVAYTPPADVLPIKITRPATITIIVE